MTKADVVVHEGVKYRKVEREARVGDYVVVVDSEDTSDYPNGEVHIIANIQGSEYYLRDINVEDRAEFLWREEFAVLEPLQKTPAMLKLTDAKPGDTVRIVDAKDYTDEGYRVGDTFEVASVWGNYCGVYTSSGASLYAEEYEVVREESIAELFFHDVKAGLEQALAVPYDEQGERIAAACDDLSALLIRKNHDYGGSFAKQYDKYGILSALIRMDDKMRRLEKLVDGNAAQVNESIEDTLIDLAGYALLAAVELRKTKP